MVYEYHCEKCGESFDVIKSVKDYDKPENCQSCGCLMIRAFCPQKIHLYNTSVQESYFHPALGQVVRGDNHARQIAKERGMIEVGNERPEKHLTPKLSDYDD